MTLRWSARVLLYALLGAAVVFASAAPALALQMYTVNGHITDNTTGATVEGVCIIIGPPAGCPPTAPITNANGDWSTQLIDGSEWDVWYSKSGYALEHDLIPATIATNPYILNHKLTPTGGTTGSGSCLAGNQTTPTQTIYLPNVTKTLGGSSGWVTPFIVQNTGAVVTTIEVSFYKFSDGSCVARRTVSLLAPGTSFADVPNNDVDLPGDTQFSVVVKSFGSSIVSVVNEHAGTGTRAEALSYNGVSSGATRVSLPNIVRRFFGYHTPFIIQNLGTGTTTATATFRPFAGSSSVQVVRNIAPGQSQFVEPNVEPVLTDGTQYAVTVTATQPVAVVVNTHNDDPSVAQPVAYSTNGIVSGGEAIYGPYAAKNANDQGFTGTMSTIVVQNLGSLAITPALAFRPLGGGLPTNFTGPNIASGAAWAFDPRYKDGVAGGTLCDPAATEGCLADGEYSFVASAASGNLAAAVNVISPDTAMGYIALAQPAQKFFLPNVTRALGGSSGWTTPILLQSVAATGATVEWRRFSDGQLVTTQNLSLTRSSSIRIDPRAIPLLADDTQYAVTITGTDGTVTAIVTELNFAGGDGAMAYEGFAAP